MPTMNFLLHTNKDDNEIVSLHHFDINNTRINDLSLKQKEECLKTWFTYSFFYKRWLDLTQAYEVKMSALFRTLVEMMCMIVIGWMIKPESFGLCFIQ